MALAREAEQAGIDRIMIDLEREGKEARQAGRDLFHSGHRLEAVARIKAALRVAPIVARVNPLSDRSEAEIERVLEVGASFVMLPYFAHASAVRRFVGIVRGRCGTIALVETKEAAAHFDEIVRARGLDEVHIGLNDLSISLGHRVIFESLCSGLIEHLTGILRRSGRPFGFGGVARLSATDLPVDPVSVLAEQVRLGASRAWLGRTFRDPFEGERAPGAWDREVMSLRDEIRRWEQAAVVELETNRVRLARQVYAWTQRT